MAMSPIARIKRILQGSQWAILTATREAVGPASHPSNVRSNQQLAKILDAWGLAYEQIQGVYKGVDQGLSFLIIGRITTRTALKLAALFCQESVLVPAGLLFHDGRLIPAIPEGTVFGKAAERCAYFSRFSDGTAFSIGLDFSQNT